MFQVLHIWNFCFQDSAKLLKCFDDVFTRNILKLILWIIIKAEVLFWWKLDSRYIYDYIIRSFIIAIATGRRPTCSFEFPRIFQEEHFILVFYSIFIRFVSTVGKDDEFPLFI